MSTMYKVLGNCYPAGYGRFGSKYYEQFLKKVFGPACESLLELCMKLNVLNRQTYDELLNEIFSNTEKDLQTYFKRWEPCWFMTTLLKVSGAESPDFKSIPRSLVPSA